MFEEFDDFDPRADEEFGDVDNLPFDDDDEEEDEEYDEYHPDYDPFWDDEEDDDADD